MRVRSFALRIALLSSAISGVVLAAFGIVAWLRIEAIDLDRIDADAATRMLPHLAHREITDERWHRIQTMLSYTYGSDAHRLAVVEPGGVILRRSPEWPDAWTPEDLPALTTPMSPPDGRRQPPPHRSPADAPGGRHTPASLLQPEFTTLRTDGAAWRVAVVGNRDITLAVAISLGEHRAYMRRVGIAFLTVLPLALALIAGGGWLLARRALRPIDRVTSAAENVTASGLDRRIESEGEDAEFARLISVFNAMMDRLERSFDQATRFSADAAHELKTPLAVLQGEIEAALHAAPEGSAEQRAFGALLDEVQRLKAITEKLLLLSRADAGTLRLQRQPTDLSAAVRMMCEDAEVLAPEMEVTCEVAGGLQVHADPDLLDRVLHNLLSNAIKHNRPDGAVQITLTAEGGEARLTVANTGPEIPPDDRERIFDRFHRVDRSRDRRVEGAGLGLSLSREIVRAHDGDLTLVSSDRRQTVFALTLPLTGG